MWSAATLAPSFSALEADVAAQLAPVRGIERSQLRADWHRYAVSWIIAALSSRRSVPATRGPARGRSGEGMGAHASAAFPRGRRNGSGTARNTPSPREGARRFPRGFLRRKQTPARAVQGGLRPDALTSMRGANGAIRDREVRVAHPLSGSLVPLLARPDFFEVL